MLNLEIPTAVLIIDVQNFIFAEGAVNAKAFLENVKKVEAFALAKKLLTIYVQHAGAKGTPEESGTEGWKIHPGLLADGPTFEKTTLSAFDSSGIGDFLKSHNIKQVVICGMQSDYCINANSRACQNEGYETYVIEDAHTTCDSGEKSGEEIVAEINAKLGEVVKLVSTQDFISTVS